MQYTLDQPVIAGVGVEKYKCTIQWRNGEFIADEPEKAGGKGAGPDPYTLLLSSLGTCTLVTMRMYIERKGWDIPHIGITLNLFFRLEGEKKITVIDRGLDFISPVTDEQRQRLIQIGKACPISKMLEGEIRIRTFDTPLQSEVVILEP